MCSAACHAQSGRSWVGPCSLPCDRGSIVHAHFPAAFWGGQSRSCSFLAALGRPQAHRRGRRWALTEGSGAAEPPRRPRACGGRGPNGPGAWRAQRGRKGWRPHKWDSVPIPPQLLGAFEGSAANSGAFFPAPGWPGFAPGRRVCVDRWHCLGWGLGEAPAAAHTAGVTGWPEYTREVRVQRV